MNLLIVRHAIAEDRGVFAETGRPDSERPLTDPGRERMIRAARGLHRVVPEISVLGTSPYTRARQTADIIAEEYDGLQIEETDTLAHAAYPADFLSWLSRLEGADTVAAVGHEPDLSELVSWLVTGADDPFFGFKKGGACLLTFGGRVAEGSAELLWLLTPRVLRRLASG